MNERRGYRLGLRERLWLTVVMAIAVVVLALTWGFNLVVDNRLDHEANTVAQARASAELDALQVTTRGVRLSETLDTGAADTPTWVFQGKRPLEEPRRTHIDDATLVSLTQRFSGFRDLPSRDIRLYAVPVLSANRQVGTVISAVSLGPYERIKRVAMIGSAMLALVALAAVAIAARWLISRALRPVAQMTRQAADWSEHDLERRFVLGEPRDELTTLAATLDGLLDRVASSLRREQNLTAELSHELRTPLTQISAEAQYALRHPDGSDEDLDGYRRILASAKHMSQILDTLISAARSQAAGAHARADAVTTARAAIHSYFTLASERGIEIELHAAAGLVVAGVEGTLLERMLAPLLENACRYASQRVTVTVAEKGPVVEIAISDDGPGVPEVDRERVFSPGYRVNGGPENDDARALKTAGAPTMVATGAGLGLPLARRLARTAGGDVRLAPTPHGATFVVSVPRGEVSQRVAERLKSST